MSPNALHTPDSAASSPGAILKRCREYHDISLAEAETATKIGAEYLQALEEDRISQFASLAYLKGFVRIYAGYLGLSPDDIIRLYEKMYAGGTGVARENAAPAAPSGERRRTVPRFPLQRLAIPAVLLILIVITSMVIRRSPEKPPAPAPPAPAAPLPLQPARTTATSSAPAKPEERPAAEPKRSEPAPARQSTPADETSRGFVVRLKVVQGGTLAVTIDGATSQGYDLVVGDSIEWKADRTITLELSNPGGVEVEMNGKPLKPFRQTGKPAVIVLEPDGIKP